MAIKDNLGMISFLVTVLVVIVAARYLVVPLIEEGLDGGNGNPDLGNVERVSDGDTLVMKDGSRVRLLCINTQETGQVWAQEAKDRLREYVEMGGNKVRLETDTTDKDGSGRLLRFVYVTDENGTDHNVCLEMVREGMGNAYVWYNTEAFADEYFGAEREARENERGFWQPSPYDIQITNVQFTTIDGKDEWIEFRNNASAQINLDTWTIKEQWSEYTLPRFFLQPKATVRLHTYHGTDNATDIYMGHDWEFWSNKGSAAFLRDAGGLMADFYEYGDRVIG